MKASYDMISDQLLSSVVPWWKEITMWTHPLLISDPFVKEFVCTFAVKAQVAEDTTPDLIDNLATTIQNITAIDPKSPLLAEIVGNQNSIMSKVAKYNTNMAKVDAVNRLISVLES